MQNKPGKGQVEVRHYKSLEPTEDMKQWPNGKELLEVLSKERVSPEQQQGDEAFWQAVFRWSLLKKHGLCPDHLQDPHVPMAKRPTMLQDDDTTSMASLLPRTKLLFSKEDIETIAELWYEQCELAKLFPKEKKDDLTEFLNSATSNGRPLQWSVLDCGPACQFKLHAHPNLEIIYCVSGALHEIRMEGGPVTKSFEQVEESTGGRSTGNHLKGPDLSSLGRPWKFDTLFEGNMLVNEVGSIHRSFCATNGDGCLLLVLWGGSHADVPPSQEPRSVSIQGAMDKMDQRLCDCGSQGETLSETFLPESEKSKNT